MEWDLSLVSFSAHVGLHNLPSYLDRLSLFLCCTPVFSGQGNGCGGLAGMTGWGLITKVKRTD